MNKTVNGNEINLKLNEVEFDTIVTALKQRKNFAFTVLENCERNESHNVWTKRCINLNDLVDKIEN